MIQSIAHPSRIQDVRFCRHPLATDSDSSVDDSELLLVAAEDKKVTVYARGPELAVSIGKAANSDRSDDDETGELESSYGIVAELVGHSNRYVRFAYRLIQKSCFDLTATTILPCFH